MDWYSLCCEWLSEGLRFSTCEIMLQQSCSVVMRVFGFLTHVGTTTNLVLGVQVCFAERTWGTAAAGTNDSTLDAVDFATSERPDVMRLGSRTRGIVCRGRHGVSSTQIATSASAHALGVSKVCVLATDGGAADVRETSHVVLSPSQARAALHVRFVTNLGSDEHVGVGNGEIVRERKALRFLECRLMEGSFFVVHAHIRLRARLNARRVIHENGIRRIRHRNVRV